MTTPNPSHTQIVNEMIVRLRELQGSGEYVPLSRMVAPGSGLAGGGSLESDVTLALSADTLAQIDKVRTSSWVTTSTTSASPTANTIPVRDASGRMKSAAPSATNDVATLQTVNDATARVVKTVTGDPSLQIAVRDLATHNTASEVSGVLYILVE